MFVLVHAPRLAHAGSLAHTQRHNTHTHTIVCIQRLRKTFRSQPSPSILWLGQVFQQLPSPDKPSHWPNIV